MPDNDPTPPEWPEGIEGRLSIDMPPEQTIQISYIKLQVLDAQIKTVFDMQAQILSELQGRPASEIRNEISRKSIQNVSDALQSMREGGEG